jgi:GNAT superfamily N-acetyltransferase
MQPAPAIVVLGEEKLDNAISVLVSAFLKDPIFNHFFPDQSVRSKVFELFFSDILRGQIKSKSAYGISDGNVLSAVAVWMPPHPIEPDDADNARGEQTLSELRKLDAAAADSIISGFEGLAALHPEVPHWYLMFVGVRPGTQRKGLGSQLLKHIHQQADEQGMPCYLETPFPETRAFYGSLGYQVTRELRAFGDAPKLWTMLRPPQAQPSAP